MRLRRGTAVAIALLGAALAAAGCGLGPGDDVGDVSLTVTRDYGAETLLRASVENVAESDTVMRVLDREAELETRYGGGFVQSIDGLEADRAGDRYWDWLYYVNGVEAAVGAAEFELRGGEAIWWDYRDWSAALRVPAVVGSWPQPFTGGYEGRRRSVRVECMGEGRPCAEVRTALEAAGADLAPAAARSSAVGEEAIRVLVGPWSRVRRDPAAALLERGVQASGVFAEFERRGGGFALRALAEDGGRARLLGAGAGLVAATRRSEEPPVWLVTGAGPAGVEAATGLLDAASLRDRYAVAVAGDEEIPLPLPAR